MNTQHAGTIVDVRTPEEFSRGNVAGSINIPLQEIEARMDEIKMLKSPILLCCASGNRSSLAFRMLSRQGIDCKNAGSWMEVQNLISQSA